MFATVAFSLSLVLTALLAWRVAGYLVTALGLGPFSPGALFTALWPSLLLAPMALVARQAKDFDLGLVAAAVFALIGLVATRQLRVGPRPEPRISTRTWFWVAVALIFLLYAWVSTQYQMHDEHSLFGHKSMIEQLRRGVYPLYFPPLPLQEARYHYGFDLLAGALARAYGLSADHAIDLVTVLLAVGMSFAAAAVAVDNDAQTSAPLAALAIHLGAGLAFVMLAPIEGVNARCLLQYHHPSCGVDLFPVQFLNVFQHPVSLGVPLMLVASMLLPRLARPGLNVVTPWLFGVVVVLMAALSVGQFVYYALIGLAALSAYPFYSIDWPGAYRRPYGLLLLLLALGLSLLWARGIGGMLAPNYAIDPTLFARRPEWGFPENTPPLGMLYHHLVNLGLPFLLFPVLVGVALLRRRPGLLTLLAFATGGMLVPHLYVYARSWDVVKFPSAAAFALSMAYVLVIDRALAGRPPPFTWLRRLGAGLLMGSGITAAAFVVKPLAPPRTLYSLGTFQVDPLIGQCIEWLKAHDYRSEELIMAQTNVVQQLSIFGGLSVVGADTDLYYVGIKLDLLYRQRAYADRLKKGLDPVVIRELNVRWLIYSDEELNNLSADARARLEDPNGPFEEVAAFPGEGKGKTRRIYHLKASARGAPPAPGSAATSSTSSAAAPGPTPRPPPDAGTTAP